MALETERCSPSNASSPGPTTNRRPGSEGGSSSGYPQNNPSGTEDRASDTKQSKPKSAFHHIALLTRSASPPLSTSSTFDPKPCETSKPAIFSHSSNDSRPGVPFDRPSFRVRRVPDLKTPSRPLSNESSSNHSARRSPIDKHLFSDSSPPSSPLGPQSPEQRNGFVGDSRLYHPNMASLSLVYGLGVIPNRFPLSLHLPSVYPEVERGFTSLPRVPTILPVKPPDPFSMFIGRPVPENQSFMESRLMNTIKPQLGAKTGKEGTMFSGVARYGEPDFKAGSSCASQGLQGLRCDCCRSLSPSVVSRSPSPHQHPPGPSSLTFSVDNILRPDFGRCPRSHKSTVSSGQQVRRVKTSKNVMQTPSDIEDDDSPVGPKKPSSNSEKSGSSSREEKDSDGQVWPAWVYCTRYSDRPSSGPRSRRVKRKEKRPEEKRPRTAFSGEQLSRLKSEFTESRYLTERRRKQLANELGLNEAQIKIWFQNKRAKIKKATGTKNPLALQLMAQGLYNHSTVPLSEDEDDMDPNRQ